MSKDTISSVDIVYDIVQTKSDEARHILAVLVDNEYGVLARVIGLFSARGYNIESLTVAEVDYEKNLSRITVVTSGTEAVLEQITKQLERIIPVHKVHDITAEGAHVERELALIKVVCEGDTRIEVLRIADMFHTKAVDSTNASFVFEMTGTVEKIDAFIDLMRPLGLAEICRTGVAAMSRGQEKF